MKSDYKLFCVINPKLSENEMLVGITQNEQVIDAVGQGGVVLTFGYELLENAVGMYEIITSDAGMHDKIVDALRLEARRQQRKHGRKTNITSHTRFERNKKTGEFELKEDV